MYKVIFAVVLILLTSACAKTGGLQGDKEPTPPEAVSVQDVEVDMSQRAETLLEQFPVNNAEGVLAQMHVAFDSKNSFDGNGALKIALPDKTTQTLPLYESKNALPKGKPLLIRARLKTSEAFSGQVFMEVSASFSANGDFVSRGVASGVGSTKGQWVTVESPFYPNPDDARPETLRVAITATGPGTLWVDDVQLFVTQKNIGELPAPQDI